MKTSSVFLPLRHKHHNSHQINMIMCVRLRYITYLSVQVPYDKINWCLSTLNPFYSFADTPDHFANNWSLFLFPEGCALVFNLFMDNEVLFSIGLTRPPMYPFSAGQYPYPMLSPEMSQVAASW